MEGSNPTPYFFVKEIFLNIIIALRRLFIKFLLHFKCFYSTVAIFFVCSFLFCCILSIFVSSISSFTYNSFHYQFIQHVHLQYERIQRK